MNTKKPFTKAELDAAKVDLLRDGRWGNACVSVATINGKRWTIKDFSNRPWLVKMTFAPFVLNRELNMVRRLEGMKNVPNEAFMVTPHILAITYIPGKSLSSFKNGDITPEFLEKAEDLIRQLHDRNLVHLDTRGTGNWLVTPDGEPAIIDFQAGMKTSHLPKALRSYMQDMDMGGVYKKWEQFCPDEMGDFRKEELKRINKLRKLWKIRGYLGKRGTHKHGSTIDE